jgi:hypothetical protein
VATDLGNETRDVVNVYPATANGIATPLTTTLLAIGDITGFAVDAAGDIYVCGPSIAGNPPSDFYNIQIFAHAAAGQSTPTSVITSPFNIEGVAVDSAGNILAGVEDSTTGTAAAIEKFAPSATGAAVPINIINIPLQAGFYDEFVGALHIDTAGNLYAGVTFWGANLTESFNIYSYGPAATGSATPATELTGLRGLILSPFALD